MESKPASILIKFVWKQFVPDTRAYKPSAPVIEVNYVIGVDVPLTHEFIYNSMEIIKGQLSGNEGPTPVLTPLGMRYCIDQFEKVMVTPDTSTNAESGDWDEGEEEEIKVDSFEEAKKEVQRREDKELAERIVKGIFD